MNQVKNSLLICLLVFGLSSCGIFTQNRIFQTNTKKHKKETDIVGDSLLNQTAKIVSNYKIHESDQLEIKVYTNKGERLIDPNGEFLQSIANLSSGAQGAINGLGNLYTVMQDGTASFPMVGIVNVQGLTTRQLDSLLQIKYSVYYQDVFVVSKCANRRVIVFGNNAGNNAGNNNNNINGGNNILAGASYSGGLNGQIIKLEYEKMSLIEIIALAGGMDDQTFSYKIKLIRGNLNNPNVYQLDLSTIEGMKQSQMYVQPNDIIYFERMRKPFRQMLREIYPFVSFSSLITSFTVLLITLRK